MFAIHVMNEDYEMIKARLGENEVKIRLAVKGTPQYGDCVLLAKAIYRAAYGASINPSPDCFISFTYDSNSELIACAGLSFGAGGSLFSEQYLDNDLETTLYNVFGREVRRTKTAEIGSMVSRNPIFYFEMVRTIPIVCWYLGMEAILCTSTKRILMIFEDHKLPFTAVAFPDPQKLKNSNNSDWGTYYQADPRTGIGRLDQIGHLFQQYCGKYNLFDSLPTPPMARAEASHMPEYAKV